MLPIAWSGRMYTIRPETVGRKNGRRNVSEIECAALCLILANSGLRKE